MRVLIEKLVDDGFLAEVIYTSQSKKRKRKGFVELGTRTDVPEGENVSIGIAKDRENHDFNILTTIFRSHGLLWVNERRVDSEKVFEYPVGDVPQIRVSVLTS
jgi:hypothetical protein